MAAVRLASSALFAVVVAAAIISISTSAHAASRNVRIELTGSCGENAGLLETRAAARGVTVLSSSEDLASVRVVTDKDSGAIQGTLVLSRAAGTTTRAVTATTCSEVLDALAFTLALALEGEPEEPPAPAAPPAPTATPLAPTTPRSPDVPSPSPPQQSEPAHTELAIGAGGGAILATAPSAGGAIAAWAMLGRRSSTSFLSPAAFAGIVFALPVETIEGANRATSTLQAATLDLCPVRIGLPGPSVALRACARGLLGRAQARSEGFQGARLDERTFGAAGLSVRGEGKITDPLFVSVQLGAALPTERSTYFVGDSRVFETPVLLLEGAIALGVHFL